MNNKSGGKESETNQIINIYKEKGHKLYVMIDVDLLSFKLF